jgi:hypothetical protein
MEPPQNTISVFFQVKHCQVPERAEDKGSFQNFNIKL